MSGYDAAIGRFLRIVQDTPCTLSNERREAAVQYMIEITAKASDAELRLALARVADWIIHATNATDDGTDTSRDESWHYMAIRGKCIFSELESRHGAQRIPGLGDDSGAGHNLVNLL